MSPVREVAVTTLRRAGYKVLTASNAAEGRALAATRLPDLTLVVSDVVMPRGSGLTLTADLRRMRADLRFLFASGYALEC